MIPGLINPKRIISTNNCRLANRQLSSRDGTYVYQCHANLTIFINFNLIHHIQLLNHNSLQYDNITISIMYFRNSLQYLNISTSPIFHNIILPSLSSPSLKPLPNCMLYTFHVIPDQWPLPEQDNTYNV